VWLLTDASAGARWWTPARVLLLATVAVLCLPAWWMLLVGVVFVPVFLLAAARAARALVGAGGGSAGTGSAARQLAA
jgi:hypothetical protein